MIVEIGSRVDTSEHIFDLNNCKSQIPVTVSRYQKLVDLMDVDGFSKATMNMPMELQDEIWNIGLLLLKSTTTMEDLSKHIRRLEKLSTIEFKRYFKEEK